MLEQQAAYHLEPQAIIVAKEQKEQRLQRTCSSCLDRMVLSEEGLQWLVIKHSPNLGSQIEELRLWLRECNMALVDKLQPGALLAIVQGYNYRSDLSYEGQLVRPVALVASEDGVLYQSSGFELGYTDDYNKNLVRWQ